MCEEKSKFYHCESKKCKIEPHETIHINKETGKKIQIKDNFCITHQVVICSCGWEWGFHNGENSKLLKIK